MRSQIIKTTIEKAKIHDTTMPLLNSMYNEFKELSKKKPDASVSKYKINIVNRLLDNVRIILVDEEHIDFLDVLNEDDIPQVSDVTLILSQYVAAMKEFKEKYNGWNGVEHGWFTDN